MCVHGGKAARRRPSGLFLGYRGVIRADTGKRHFGMSSVNANNGDGHGSGITAANGVGYCVGEAVGG